MKIRVILFFLISAIVTLHAEALGPLTPLMQDMKMRKERTLIAITKPRRVVLVQGKASTEYFHTLWNTMPEVSVEEMLYAYRCMEEIGLHRIMTQKEVLDLLDKPEPDKPEIDLSLTASMRKNGNAFEICLSYFQIRYSQNPKKQKEEQIAVTNAAMSAVIKVHRKKMDNREADYAKRYPLPDFGKIIGKSKTVPEARATYYSLRKRAYDLQERPRLVEHFLPNEELSLARCFLRFRPTEIDRIRTELTEAGYLTPESRKAFWERVGKSNYDFFNASHLPLLYDPAKP